MNTDHSELPSRRLLQLMNRGDTEAARALCQEWAKHPAFGRHYEYMLGRLEGVQGATLAPSTMSEATPLQSISDLTGTLRTGFRAHPYKLTPNAVPPEAKLPAARDALIASSPFKAEIYRPTAKVSLAEQVIGLGRVVQLVRPENIEISRLRFEHLRNTVRERGAKRLFVIGNGPSLKQMDLTLLRDEITIGFNGIFLHPSFTPTIYVVEDHLVAEDRHREIKAYECPVKIFPSYLGYCLEAQENTIFLNHRPRISFPVDTDFSDDASRITYTGGTVTYTGLQIAASLGIRQIILLGVDASYKVQDVERSDTYGTGVLTSKSDDSNHFDPRYFGAGFRWHDPNVHTMLQAYRKARDHASSRKLEIVNATAGGQLEVFPRRDFNTFFPLERIFPRVAIIDFTSLNQLCATGRIKRNLLRGWDASELLSIVSDKTSSIQAFQSMRNDQYARGLDETSILPALRSLIEFNPALLYLRPTADRPLLVVLQAVAGALLQRPWVIHYMDDWLARLNAVARGPLADIHNQIMGYLFKYSVRAMAISEKMGRLLTDQHGMPAHKVEVVHNYVTIAQPLARRTSPPSTRLLRYFGGMEHDMGLATLLACARQVEAMATDQEPPWRFEIYTTKHGREREGPKFSQFKHTSILPQLEDDEAYFKALANSDACLICYNFDDASVRYVRYSLANKLPDLLSVEAPFLAIGHQDVGTMGLLKDLQYPLACTEKDFDLKSLLARITAPDSATITALDSARSRLREAFAENQQRVRFQALLRQNANAPACDESPPLDALDALITHAGKHWPQPIQVEAKVLLALSRLPKELTQRWLKRVRAHGLNWSVRDEFKSLSTEVKTAKDLTDGTPELRARCISMLVCSLAAERFEPINKNTRNWLLRLT